MLIFLSRLHDRLTFNFIFSSFKYYHSFFISRREDQFNSLLSEIMYNERLDMMDVDELIERMNKRKESCKPFSLLEVKPFLQKLHRDNRIFLVEEEGRNGVVYAI